MDRFRRKKLNPNLLLPRQNDAFIMEDICSVMPLFAVGVYSVGLYLSQDYLRGSKDNNSLVGMVYLLQMEHIFSCYIKTIIIESQGHLKEVSPA